MLFAKWTTALTGPYEDIPLPAESEFVDWESELGGVRPDLAISGRLNGATVQASRTNDLVVGVPELVEYLTTIMTMEPEDVVLTGTSSGVGFATEPPVSLCDGDLFEVEIEGIGSRTRSRRTLNARFSDGGPLMLCDPLARPA